MRRRSGFDLLAATLLMLVLVVGPAVCQAPRAGRRERAAQELRRPRQLRPRRRAHNSQRREAPARHSRAQALCAPTWPQCLPRSARAPPPRPSDNPASQGGSSQTTAPERLAAASAVLPVPVLRAHPRRQHARRLAVSPCAAPPRAASASVRPPARPEESDPTAAESASAPPAQLEPPRLGSPLGHKCIALRPKCLEPGPPCIPLVLALTLCFSNFLGSTAPRCLPDPGGAAGWESSRES